MLAPENAATLTFAKLTVLLVRRIVRPAIINVIAPQGLGDAVFILAAQKLILTIGVGAHFRPHRAKTLLTRRLVG